MCHPFLDDYIISNTFINLHFRCTALVNNDSVIKAADKDMALLCGRRKNIIVKSFSYWREPEERPASHVYDLRSYVLQVRPIAISYAHI